MQIGGPPTDNKAIRDIAATSEKSATLLENLTILTSSVDKLGLSVEKLSKSSERLEHLTKLLIALTFFLAGLTTFDLYNAHPSIVTYLYIIFAFMVGLYAAFGRNVITILHGRWKSFLNKK